jgi:hypothetical protein
MIANLISIKTILLIDRNCNVLPFSLADLLNHTTLMLKFCKKQADRGFATEACFFLWGKGGVLLKKGCNVPYVG